jgi:hypothetical protein
MVVEDTFSKVSEASFHFLFFLDKRKKRNQERTPTAILFSLEKSPQCH